MSIKVKGVKILPENFEEIRRELIFLLSRHLDLYIKHSKIYGNDMNEYESHIKLITNIINKLQQLKCMNTINNMQ